MNSIKERLSFLSPITWPAWLGLSILWLVSRLPYKWQYSIGRAIGRGIYRISPKLREITKVNIELCFPELSATEQQELIHKNFESLGLGLVETGMAWWLSDQQLAKCDITIRGLEHLDKGLARGKGIILLGPHFTCLEMIARLLGTRFQFAVMYRPHKKAVVARILEKFRQKYRIKTIARHQMRELIRTLNDNVAVWYAYDVDGGEKRSVFAPFFGIQTASLTSVSRLVELCDTTIIPISFYRLDDRWGYEIVLSPPIENISTKNYAEDAALFNASVEKGIRAKPEQYIWQYKRFKTRPPGEKRLY